MSQSELARQSDVKQPTIWAIENEGSCPRLNTAQKLAAALNCTLDELVNGDDQKPA